MMNGSNMFNKSFVEQSMKTGMSVVEAFNHCIEYSSRGNRDAMGCLARMYRDGIGTEKNLDLAIYWMRSAYLKKLSYARFELSVMLAKRSEEDGKLAFNLCKDEVNKDNPKAYAQMAFLYTKGIGCPCDDNMAIDYMSYAYSQGYEWAGLELVKMLTKRKDGGDLGKAFEICTKLSQNGNIKASGFLGQMYRDGVGCVPDRELAIEHLKIAAPKYEWAHRDLVNLLSQ